MSELPTNADRQERLQWLIRENEALRRERDDLMKELQRLQDDAHDHCAICDVQLAGEHECATATEFAVGATTRINELEQELVVASVGEQEKAAIVRRATSRVRTQVPTQGGSPEVSERRLAPDSNEGRP